MNFFKKFEKLKVKYKTNKKRILSITVTAVGIACLLIGSSMAYLLFEASGTTQTISAGTLQLSYTNESEAIILNNAVPQSDEQGLNNNVYSITLTNTSTIKSYYELSLNNNCTVGNSYTVNGSSVTANVCIPNNYLKVAVKTNKDEDYKITSGSNVILKGYLEAKENISFEMIIWLTEETPNDYQGQTETGTPRNVIYNGNFKIYTRQMLGNEYTITNMIKNGDFEKDAANWELSGASITSDEKYSGGKSLMLSPNTTAMSTQTLSSTAPVLNHKYYGSIMYKTVSGLTAADNRFEWYNTDNSDALMVFANKKDTQGKWERLSGIGQITSTSYLDKSWYVRNFMVNATTNSYVDEVMIVDLTETFGAGNEPTKEWCDENINYFEGTTIIKVEPKGTDTLIALTDNKDNSGLYRITHQKDSTLQIGNDKNITEYRYRGASPKNYVTFNNEVWRIIGVFPTDDGTGKIENRIKIIKDQSIGNKYWDTGNSNNWARPATLNTELNTTYLNSLDSTSKSMIGNTKFYLGGYNNSLRIQKDVMYQYERKINGSTYYNGSNPNNFIGKLGLMYASDYGYAASDECIQNLYSYDDTTCKNNNWLYNIKVSEWILLQSASGSEFAFRVNSVGNVSSGYNVSSNQLAVRPVIYLKPDVKIIVGHGTSTDPYVIGMTQKDTSGANAPVLASNMIPVYYDDSKNVWKCADKDNKDIVTRWYNYDYKMWANAVTINYSDSSIKNRYFNSDGTLKIKPGEEVLMADITTMWVWIPRFNAVTPSNYNGGTQAKPNAIDVTFVKQNETALYAFTFGNKELSGFWYGKFETSHTTLASSSTKNNLGCTNETCSNANGIIIKPNETSLRYNNVSNFFFASRSMEQPNNSFGFISSEVDTHMSKNNEWGAVAYLTHSIYGRCTSSTTCTEVGINNNGSYKTGYGAPAGSNTSVTNGAYYTSLGKDASTTGNIYGIYDMSGGAGEFVMGVYNKKPDASGFNILPDEKYYNNYTGTSYTGHALTETKNWYSDYADFVGSAFPWFVRGGVYYNSSSAGVFGFSRDIGNSNFLNSSGDSLSVNSSRIVISNKL